jgi:hypothetical protein
LSSELNDLQKYNEDLNVWESISNLNSLSTLHGATAFVIGNTVYLGTGYNYGQSLANFMNYSVVGTAVSNVVADDLHKVYYNPQTSKISFDFKNLKDNCLISIFNLNGQQLVNEKVSVDKNYIEINNLLRGIYLLKISNGNNTSVYKILKGN